MIVARLTSCISAFGIEPEVLLDKATLLGAMESVGLDDKSRQTIFTSISKRKPDALSGVSSARSTPVLSLPSPSPAAYSGPTPIPVQPVQPSPVLTQSPSVPSPVRADAPKARGKPKWMARDLDIFRQEKMANAGGAPVTPTTPQPVTPASHLSLGHPLE